MRKYIPVSLVLLVTCAFASSSVAAAKPARQILGLRLSMKTADAHARLKAIGTFVRSVEGAQEVWKVHDSSYANILVGFNKDGQLRYITAVARTDKDAKPVSYASIGDLAKAKQAGNPKIKLYNYQWHLPADKGQPETLVLAIGRDPTNLSTYSLKRLGEGAAAEDDD